MLWQLWTLVFRKLLAFSLFNNLPYLICRYCFLNECSFFFLCSFFFSFSFLFSFLSGANSQTTTPVQLVRSVVLPAWGWQQKATVLLSEGQTWFIQSKEWILQFFSKKLQTELWMKGETCSFARQGCNHNERWAGGQKEI